MEQQSGAEKMHPNAPAGLGFFLCQKRTMLYYNGRPDWICGSVDRKKSGGAVAVPSVLLPENSNK